MISKWQEDSLDWTWTWTLEDSILFHHRLPSKESTHQCLLLKERRSSQDVGQWCLELPVSMPIPESILTPQPQLIFLHFHDEDGVFSICSEMTLTWPSWTTALKSWPLSAAPQWTSQVLQSGQQPNSYFNFVEVSMSTLFSAQNLFVYLEFWWLKFFQMQNSPHFIDTLVKKLM